MGRPINQNYVSARLGKSCKNNEGYLMTIIGYRKASDIDVIFENGSIVQHRSYKDFKTGSIQMPNSPNIFGHGIYDSNSNGHYDNSKTSTKAFHHWVGMLERCYSEKIKKKHPTYEECFCCDSWLKFSNFEEWFKHNYYEIPDCKYRMELDKDILSRYLLGTTSKYYSEETACFVPRDLNLLLCKRDLHRGELPVGVTKNNKVGYIARLNIDGRRKYLGWSKDPYEAFLLYKKAKEKETIRKANLYKTYLPKNVYEALINYEVNVDD